MIHLNGIQSAEHNETTLGGPWGRRKRERLCEALCSPTLPMGMQRTQSNFREPEGDG